MAKNNLPDFLVVGAMKAGTTTMFEILNQHSCISMADEKEVHFFDYDEKVKLGLSYYKSFFNVLPSTLAVGEATPIYLFHPEVPGRIAEMLGKQTKIIILLRDPVNRAISHYRMTFQRKRTNESLSKSIEHNVLRLKRDNHYWDRDFSFIERSLYYNQLKRYFDLFPAENIKIIHFEKEFINDRRKTINETFDFLGVPVENVSIDVHLMKTALVKNEAVNQILNTGHPLNQFVKRLIPSKNIRNKIKLQLNKINSKQFVLKDNIEEIRERLIRDFFYEDIKKTEDLLNMDLSSWYK